MRGDPPFASDLAEAGGPYRLASSSRRREVIEGVAAVPWPGAVSSVRVPVGGPPAREPLMCLAVAGGSRDASIMLEGGISDIG
ncbi:hypothetical protein ABH926_000375 [Catenulispora sp. GP43]